MEQVIFGGYFNTLDPTATEYTSLVGGYVWSATEAFRYKLVSTDGVIKWLRARLTGAPGAGKKYTFTLMLNGSPTALTFDISDLETSGSDMVHEIDVTAGDTISIRCVPDGTPIARVAAWSSVFEGDVPKESLILGGSGIALHTIDTEYAQVMGARTDWGITENDFRQVVPTSGVIKNFYVLLDKSPGTAPEAFRLTVRLNGATVAQSLIVTITADDIAGSDLVHNLVVVAGDVLTLMSEPLNSPSETDSWAIWGMTFVADVDGESIILGGTSIELDDTATEYGRLTSLELLGWYATESNRYQLGQGCVLKKLYMLLSTAPGAGKKYDFTTRIAGADGNIAVTISDAATTGNSGALTDTVALDDYVNLKVVPSATPNVADSYWGIVCYTGPPAPQTGMEQVIFGGYRGNLLDPTATEYNSLVGAYSWTATERLRHKIVSADGVIKKLRVKLDDSPGAGKSYTFTLMVNGIPRPLAIDIADAATSGRDTVHEVRVTGGDYISLRCDPTGTPTARLATWTIMFESDAPNESLILGGTGFSLNNAATEYAQVMTATSSHDVTENNYREVVPTGGTIKDLYVRLNIDPGTAPDAYRFTVRLNGATVAQSLIVTITADDTTGSDLVHNLVVVAGDILTMMIEPLNAPSATPTAQWGMTFVATINRESIVMGGSHNNLPDVDTEYNQFTSYEGRTWYPDETIRYQLGQVCILKKLHILLADSPGAGNKYDFTIRIAGADSNVVATVADAATTGNSGALEDIVADEDYVNLKVIPTDTPTIRDAYWGLVSYMGLWTGKISGVTNPAKIMGVSVVNIAEVKGIE